MPNKYGSRKRDLCFSEKVAIAQFERVSLINERTELGDIEMSL